MTADGQTTGQGSRRLGEFGRIARYFAPLAAPGGLGLTDDAALVDCAPGHRLVMTVDAMVEGVHYLPTDPPDLVARKLLRVNLSDLAAMGARPLHYLLTTALPASFDDEWVGRFAAGLAEDQRLFGVSLLGGDSVSTPGPPTFSLTAIGEVEAGREIRRAGAQPGDRIWVTGTIGDAYLGLAVLRGEYADLPAADRAELARRFQLPDPRTTLGPRLAGIAHAMCDVSDGLIADLGHICDASGVGAMVNLSELPLSPAARHLANITTGLRVELATGGDDYELLFTAPDEDGAAIGEIVRETGMGITAIGAITVGSDVVAIEADGVALQLDHSGYRHF